MKILSFSLVLAGLALSSAAHAVTIHGGSGVGSFQDVQVPLNETYEVRGDGTVPQEENVAHSGMLLQAGFGKESQRGRWLWQIFDFDAMQIRTSGGPAATQSASYSRLNLQSAIDYQFAFAGLLGSVGPKAGIRRSSFNNVSSAHYVESMLVGASAGLRGMTHAVEGSFAVAPYARFGYTEEGMFGGRAFEKSEASLFEAALRYSYNVNPAVWLDFAFEQETARVTIDDVNEYNDLGYGLSVQDTARPTRSYELATTAVRVGVRKTF